jgi:hypothetical protein
MVRLPEKRAELQQKHSTSFEFSELCEAYDLACDAAIYWSKSTAANALSIANDYRVMIGDIEQDILSRLVPPLHSERHRPPDAPTKPRERFRPLGLLRRVYSADHIRRLLDR